MKLWLRACLAVLLLAAGVFIVVQMPDLATSAHWLAAGVLVVCGCALLGGADS